jgi:hypothetical protein
MQDNKRSLAASRIALAAATAAAIAVPITAVAMPGNQSASAMLQGQVRVVNGVKQPVPVAPQGTQKVAVVDQGRPVSATNPMTMTPGQSSLRLDLIPVPAGKRFVIEYISGEPLVSDTGRLRVRIGGASGPQIRPPIQPAFGADEPGLIRGMISEEVHLVVDGPGVVQAEIARVDPEIGATVSSPLVVTGTMYDCSTCT